MASSGRTVFACVADASARWRTLPQVFDTPDTGRAVSAMQPTAAAATDFRDTSVTASLALSTLAETLAALEWTRTQLISDIAAHRATVLAYRRSETGSRDDPSDPLAGWGPYGFSQNAELQERCASLRALVFAALEECERDLSRIGDADGVSPMTWTSSSPRIPSLTWGQKSAAFCATVSMKILQRLADSDMDAVAELLREHPDWERMLRAHPPGASDVAAWWRTLDSARADALISGAPLIVGNLEGVDYASRDDANRLALTHAIAAAREALEAERKRDDPAWNPVGGAGGGRDSRLKILRERLDNLLNIEVALASPPNRAPRSLVSLTSDDPPLAAVSIGDLDDATNVAYAVPGMGTTTKDMTGWAAAAQNILDEQSRVSPVTRNAVVAWIGYETPPIPLSQGLFQVLDDANAEQGGLQLSRALSGLVAARPDGPALSVIGHSYGTTTSAIALTLPETPEVDAFVAVGSAGLPAAVDSAADIRANAVYAGQARNVIPVMENGQGDQWAWTGRTSPAHPIDPVSPSFGAQAFAPTVTMECIPSPTTALLSRRVRVGGTSTRAPKRFVTPRSRQPVKVVGQRQRSRRARAPENRSGGTS